MPRAGSAVAVDAPKQLSASDPPFAACSCGVTYEPHSQTKLSWGTKSAGQP
jgi:hypothetical protein